MKRYALAAAFLMAGPSLALAHHGEQTQGSPPMQQGAADCVPAPETQAPQVQSDLKPVAGYESGGYQWVPGTRPSAKTPKPSKIKSRYSVAAGTRPSAKTPK